MISLTLVSGGAFYRTLALAVPFYALKLTELVDFSAGGDFGRSGAAFEEFGVSPTSSFCDEWKRTLY